MVSLLDIAPEKREVAGVPVRALSLPDIVSLIRRFPGVMKLMQDRTIENLIEVAPDAVAAIIAATTGHMNEEDHEDAAKRLPFETQVDFLMAAIQMTMPSGIGPFVEKVVGISNQVSRGNRPPSAPTTKTPSTGSRKPSPDLSKSAGIQPPIAGPTVQSN